MRWVAAVLFFVDLALGSPGVAAQTEAALPVVEGAAPKELGDHCRRLVRFLDSHEQSFPATAIKELRALVESEAAADFSERIQKLLDAHCLLSVTINPESRVKAARGPADARLSVNRPRLVLIKVINEAGVTHPLAIAGPQLRTPGENNGGHWLEAVLQNSPPLPKALSGQKVEYAVLQLTARESGRREAVLTFDVGQGTQDLGFRAEVAILFSVRE